MLISCFIILVMGLAMVVMGVPKGQYFITQPSDMTGVAGDHLILDCVIGNMVGSCQWTKDGVGLGQDPRLSLDTDKPGDCRLMIFPVLPEDQGTYQCQVGPGGELPAMVSESANVKVDIPPGQPVIKQAGVALEIVENSDTIEIVEGEEVVLECESTGARPAARVEWRDNTGEVITENLIEVVKENEKSKTFKTISILKMKPTQSFSLTCSAFSESFTEPRISRKLGIEVRHSPRLSLDILDKSINEGSSVMVKCDCKANPADVTFKWFINDNLQEEGSDTIKIKDIPKELDGAVIACEAENVMGRSKASKLLNVKFAPKIVTQPTTKIAKLGETVELTCLAEGNPKPSYVWVKGSPEEIVGVSSSLTLTATEDAVDQYSCKVFVDGYKPLVSHTATVQLLRKPVVFTESIKHAKVGEDVILQCRVDSFSDSTKVTWTKNDQPIGQESPKHRVLFSEGLHQFASDLIIYKVDHTDFANYGCFSSNEVGSDYKVLPLQQEEDEHMYLSASLGINSVVGIIIIVCIVIYKKRNNNKERRSEEDSRMPNMERHVLPPPYRKEDPNATRGLLFDRKMHEDYLQVNQEYLNININNKL